MSDSQRASVVWDFGKQLRDSNALNLEPAWATFYKALWPDLVGAIRVDGLSEWQRKGVDRIIYLRNGRTVLVDEKQDTHDTDNLVVEEWSSVEDRRVGWSLDGHKICDFVAYALVKKARCYLLPFELFRLTCEHNLTRWKNKKVQSTNGSIVEAYPIDARNGRWTTRNCLVSWAELARSMQAEMMRGFTHPLPLPSVWRDPLGQMVMDFGSLVEESSDGL